MLQRREPCNTWSYPTVWDTIGNSLSTLKEASLPSSEYGRKEESTEEKNLSKEVGMRTCTRKEQRQFAVILFPHQQPVAFKMAFPTTRIVPHEFMSTIRCRQHPIGLKRPNRSLEQFHIVATLAATFRIPAERPCHPYLIHVHSDAQRIKHLVGRSELLHATSLDILL